MYSLQLIKDKKKIEEWGMLFPLDTIFVESTNHWHSWKITILADAQYVCFYFSLFFFLHSLASDSRCAI